MARLSSFTEAIDECITLKISKLKDWGFLHPDVQSYSNVMTWSDRGQPTASMNYTIQNEDHDTKSLILKYDYKGEPTTHKIPIVSVPSNLGKGVRWYFMCTTTDKRCMNLILPSGYRYFAHRSAFPNLMYHSQKQSKHYRFLEKTYGWEFKLERLYGELHQKYRKSHYRGKPTPLVRKIQQIEEAFEGKEQVDLSVFLKSGISI